MMDMQRLTSIEVEALSLGTVTGAILLELMDQFAGHTEPLPELDVDYPTDDVFTHILRSAKAAVLTKTLKPCSCGASVKFVSVGSGEYYIFCGDATCPPFIAGGLERAAELWNARVDAEEVTNA